MLCKALDDVGMNPNGTLKEGYTAPSGAMSSDNLKIGLLMLLKQAILLNIFVFRTQLLRAPGVTNVQHVGAEGMLSFSLGYLSQENLPLQVNVYDQVHSLTPEEAHNSNLTGEAFKFVLSYALPEESSSSAQTHTVAANSNAYSDTIRLHFGDKNSSCDGLLQQLARIKRRIKLHKALELLSAFQKEINLFCKSSFIKELNSEFYRSQYRQHLDS